MRALARLHVRPRRRGPEQPVRQLGSPAPGSVRPCAEVAAPVFDHVLPGPAEERRMSAIAVPAARPPLWRRLIGFNMLSGVLLAVVGWLIGHFIGDRIHSPSLDFFADTGQNDISVLLRYLFGVIGFLIGLGFANYPVRRMLGHPPTLAEHEDEAEGIGR